MEIGEAGSKGGCLVCREIWVIAEQQGAEVSEATLEVLDEAIGIAKRLEYIVASVVIGHRVSGMADVLFRYGATKVYLLDHELLSNYTTDGYAKVLCDLVRQEEPPVVLFGGTRNGLDLASSVSTRLNVGLVNNCTMIRIEDDVLEMTQPIYEDRIYRNVVVKRGSPIMVTMRMGAIGKGQGNPLGQGQVVEIYPKLEPSDIRTKVVESFKADPESLDLEEVDTLVVGGRGVETKEKWGLIEELAQVLGGGTGGTRMAVDAGWISRHKQIGQTGKSVAPRTCIEAGVSGAIQHCAGLRDVDFIIAINKDRNAPIFAVANVGVVADIHQLIPPLVAKIRELCAPRDD
jgi:electron transfer flavoprotein alpha subunit